MTSVHQAWSAVMEDVQAVRKTGRNESQGFNFRGIDAVVNAVGPALRKHGVVIIPIVESANYREVEVGKNRTLQRECTVKVRYRVFGPEGDSIDDGCVYGEALDSGDKATAKAHSVAYRTFLLQALTIPTDEPDPDTHSVERAPRVVSQLVSAENAKALRDKCEQRGVDVGEVVSAGTNGRTDQPEQVLKEEVSAVREALDFLSPAETNRTVSAPSGTPLPVVSATSNGGADA